ncbi:MAG: CdaR family protein [Negativicutes bacterium]|nr:CdaR family protein [Negativicutes bacterium]
MDRTQGKNITAKILAIILASVLWLYVTNEQNPPVETSLAVPLETRNVVSPLVVVDTPDSVRVKVRGSRSMIAGLQAQDVSAVLDMRGLGEGRHYAKVAVQVPLSLELLEVSPDKVQVRLDTVVSRKLPVEIRLSGTAATGTAVARVLATPEQVTIEGPRSTVDSADKILLPLDLSGRNADFSVGVIPVVVNREGKEVEGLTVLPERVSISAQLVRGLNQKSVEVKPIVYGELAAGAVLRGITVKPAKVEISGDPQVVEKIDFIYTEPINVAGINHDTVKEAKLQLKEGMLASQSTVTVQISVITGR